MVAFSTVWNFTDGVDASSSDGIAGTNGSSSGTRSIQTGLGYSTGAVLQQQQSSASHTSATATNSYSSYVLTPDASTVDWNPEQLSFMVARGGSSTPRGIAVETSADGFASILYSADTPSVRPSWTARTVDLTSLGKLTGPLTVRIMVYGPAAVATQEMDNVTFTGQRTVSAGALVRAGRIALGLSPVGRSSAVRRAAGRVVLGLRPIGRASVVRRAAGRIALGLSPVGRSSVVRRAAGRIALGLAPVGRAGTVASLVRRGRIVLGLAPVGRSSAIRRATGRVVLALTPRGRTSAVRRVAGRLTLTLSPRGRQRAVRRAAGLLSVILSPRGIASGRPARKRRHTAVRAEIATTKTAAESSSVSLFLRAD